MVGVLGEGSVDRVRATGGTARGGAFQSRTQIHVPGVASGEAPARAVAQPASFATDAFYAINAERRANGRPEYQLSDDLSLAATARVDEMVQEGYIDHDDPDGENSYTQIMDRLGFRWTRAGENILLGLPGLTPRQMVDKFMGSRPHRANLLDGDFTQVGIASGDFRGQPLEVVLFREP